MAQTCNRVSSNYFCQGEIKLNLELNLNQNVLVKEIQQIRFFSLYISSLTKSICLLFIKMETN